MSEDACEKCGGAAPLGCVECFPALWSRGPAKAEGPGEALVITLAHGPDGRQGWHVSAQSIAGQDPIAQHRVAFKAGLREALKIVEAVPLSVWTKLMMAQSPEKGAEVIAGAVKAALVKRIRAMLERSP